ncbi:hypothetical protein M758_UG166000 [Ceratodon purpureus]|nr:hypothetical protein M758_UG166000 [Ceratodon purpureus]
MNTTFSGGYEEISSLLELSTNTEGSLNPNPRFPLPSLKFPFSFIELFSELSLGPSKCYLEYSNVDQNQRFGRLVRECNGSKINSFWWYIILPAVLNPESSEGIFH